jgi:hypothetical protein
LHDGVSEGSNKSRKSSKKAKEAEAKSYEADGATEVPKDPMRATLQANLEKAKTATKGAKGAMTAAENQMFAFYANLLSVKSKYAWNKIDVEQMESNQYVDLQGVSQTGLRGMSCKLFDHCVLFCKTSIMCVTSCYYLLSSWYTK